MSQNDQGAPCCVVSPFNQCCMAIYPYSVESAAHTVRRVHPRSSFVASCGKKRWLARTWSLLLVFRVTQMRTVGVECLPYSAVKLCGWKSEFDSWDVHHVIKEYAGFS